MVGNVLINSGRRSLLASFVVDVVRSDRVNCRPQPGEKAGIPETSDTGSVYLRDIRPGNIGPRKPTVVHVCTVSLRKAKSQRRCRWHTDTGRGSSCSQ